MLLAGSLAMFSVILYQFFIYTAHKKDLQNLERAKNGLEREIEDNIRARQKLGAASDDSNLKGIYASIEQTLQGYKDKKIVTAFKILRHKRRFQEERRTLFVDVEDIGFFLKELLRENIMRIQCIQKIPQNKKRWRIDVDLPILRQESHMRGDRKL